MVDSMKSWFDDGRRGCLRLCSARPTERVQRCDVDVSCSTSALHHLVTGDMVDLNARSMWSRVTSSGAHPASCQSPAEWKAGEWFWIMFMLPDQEVLGTHAERLGHSNRVLNDPRFLKSKEVVVKRARSCRTNG